MPWPRFCASSSRAKVESPLILIRSIGSICTAIFRLIDPPERATSAAGVECRSDMARNPSRRHQDSVEADVADARVLMTRQPRLGGSGDAQALARSHRPRGVVESRARLDLDED